MKQVVLLTILGAVVGALIGAPMGVVGYGDGWGGLYVFGVLGAIIGLLGGLALRR
jgi:uncharacterized membrane protein